MASALPPCARKILIALNPRAGARCGRQRVEQLTLLLRQDGFQVETTSDIDFLAGAADAARGAGELRCVVSAGGDGTIALVANHLAADTPLAVLPLGTENLLSKELGFAGDPLQLARTIRRGLIMRIDAGLAGGRLFLLMVGCGFDAEVVHRLHRERKGHIHHLSYVKPIVDAIRSYQYPELQVYCQPVDDAPAAGLPPSGAGSEIRLVARWVFVVNLPRYAGGLRFAPDAAGDDGLLDVCAFKGGSLWNGLRYLGGVALGRHHAWRDFVTLRTRHVRIESESAVPYQLDGDPGGDLPVEIQVLPARLTFLVPQT